MIYQQTGESPSNDQLATGVGKENEASALTLKYNKNLDFSKLKKEEQIGDDGLDQTQLVPIQSLVPSLDQFPNAICFSFNDKRGFNYTQQVGNTRSMSTTCRKPQITTKVISCFDQGDDSQGTKTISRRSKSTPTGSLGIFGTMTAKLHEQ